jgi:hypothetical protein
MTPLSFRQRLFFLLSLLLLAVLGLLALAPIPQDPDYHRFADSRPFFGIPNFNDVVSNVGFSLAGLLGMLAVWRGRHGIIFEHPADARPYLLFFAGVALVSLGSAYYHWEPSNERLFWDRLPMSVGFMAISAAVVADRIDARAGNGWLLLTLIAVGAASLIYWDWTESQGRGDLRFYGLVQFYPMVVLPAIIALFPRYRYTVGRYLVWVILWYGLSKVFEYLDHEIFALLGQTVSGHTLKHLAAAVAPLVVLQMLLSRTARRTAAAG